MVPWGIPSHSPYGHPFVWAIMLSSLDLCLCPPCRSPTIGGHGEEELTICWPITYTINTYSLIKETSLTSAFHKRASACFTNTLLVGDAFSSRSKQCPRVAFGWSVSEVSSPLKLTSPPQFFYAISILKKSGHLSYSVSLTLNSTYYVLTGGLIKRKKIGKESPVQVRSRKT